MSPSRDLLVAFDDLADGSFVGVIVHDRSWRLGRFAPK